MSQVAYPWNSLEFMKEINLSVGDRQLQIVRNRRDQSPQLLLLHGVLRNWRSFYPILPALQADYSIAALDFRGHGGSTPCNSYFVVDYVVDAAKAIEQFAEPFVLYGHSLGAMVALAAAGACPEKVKAVVLEDPPFSTMGDKLLSLNLHRYFQGVENCLLQEKPQGADAMFEAFSSIIVDHTSDGTPIRVKDQRDETARRFSAECLTHVDPQVLAPITSGNWLTGYDLFQILDKIRCPIWLLQADQRLGGMLTDHDARQIASRFPQQCKLEYFANVGHSVHWSKPDEVIKGLRRWLSL
jgi:pimeloyl-ACP methyl ester carboxylesterase